MRFSWAESMVDPTLYGFPAGPPLVGSPAFPESGELCVEPRFGAPTTRRRSRLFWAL